MAWWHNPEFILAVGLFQGWSMQPGPLANVCTPHEMIKTPFNSEAADRIIDWHLRAFVVYTIHKRSCPSLKVHELYMRINRLYRWMRNNCRAWVFRLYDMCWTSSEWFKALRRMCLGIRNGTVRVHPRVMPMIAPATLIIHPPTSHPYGTNTVSKQRECKKRNYLDGFQGCPPVCTCFCFHLPYM